MVAELRQILDSREAVSNTSLKNFNIHLAETYRFTAHTHTHTGPSLFCQAEKRPKVAAAEKAARRPQQDCGGGKPGPSVATSDFSVCHFCSLHNLIEHGPIPSPPLSFLSFVRA